MRDRLYRRYQEQRVFKNRLKYISDSRNWYNFYNADGERIINPKWIDFIGLSNLYYLKNLITSSWDSKDKDKYSPNRSGWSRRFGRKGTREYNKLLLQKILKENGL